MSDTRSEAPSSPTKAKLPPVIVRNTRPEDIPQLDALQRASYPKLSQKLLWRDHHWASHLKIFPEGQWVAEVEGRIVGVCVNLRVPYGRATRQHTWKEITGRGLLTGHDPGGDTLYGAEIMVHPDHRRRGIGKKLYQARFDYIRSHGLRGFCAMGRIPGYHRKAKEMTPQEYVEGVVSGQINDRTLTAQIKSGNKVVGVVTEYLDDAKSGNSAAIIVWENPEFPGSAGQDFGSTSETLAPDLVAGTRGH